MISGVAYPFAAFFRSFGAEFAAERADVSFVFGLSGLIYFLLGAGAGMLADRFGPRVVCAAGMAFIAAGLLASSFAHSMTAIYAAWGGGLGIGIGLVYAPAIACVPPPVRAPARASPPASPAPASASAPSPCRSSPAAAIGALDWRQALQVLALATLVIGVGATLLLRRAPTRAAPARRRAGLSLGEALRSRRFWWMYAACVCAAPVMFIPSAHVSAAARDLGIGDARAVGLVGIDRHRQHRRPLRRSAASPTASGASPASHSSRPRWARRTCSGWAPAAIRHWWCSRSGTASATAASSR